MSAETFFDPDTDIVEALMSTLDGHPCIANAMRLQGVTEILDKFCLPAARLEEREQAIKQLEVWHSTTVNQFATLAQERYEAETAGYEHLLERWTAYGDLRAWLSIAGTRQMNGSLVIDDLVVQAVDTRRKESWESLCKSLLTGSRSLAKPVLQNAFKLMTDSIHNRETLIEEVDKEIDEIEEANELLVDLRIIFEQAREFFRARSIDIREDALPV